MANRTKIENLQDLIKDSIEGELVEQKAESLLPPGENYGSCMYRVDFKVKRGDKIEEHHAVAKCTPLNTVTQEIFNTQVTFKSEIAWYTTVIPTLKQFQRDHGVEQEINFFQPFYGARISLDPKSDKVDLDGVILTQNLTYLGYHNIDRHVGFDLPTTYTILRDLATFHAVPLAIRIQSPELFDKKIKPHLPVLEDITEEEMTFFNKPLYITLEQIPECQPYKERIHKYIDEGLSYSAHPVREPWNTIVHKDFWMNNIMVTGGKDSKTMILDLQVPYFGSPASDLIFFLLASVKLDIVQEKLDEFIKYYYDEFARNLKELGVSIENYTFEGLLKEIDLEMKVGEFSHALNHSFMILSEKGKADIDSSDENFKKEDMENAEVVVNEQQIEKFKWIIFESVKRNWI